MSAPPLYLCVDCGGTKTSAVISNSAGEIVGRALGGPSNFSYLGLQPFVSVLQSTVEKALSVATSESGPIDILTASRFASVWVGVSGVDSPNDIRTLTAALSSIFSIPPGNRLQVTNDAHLLASPLRMHRELKGAVAVIAGTGSIVVSFTKGDEVGSGGSGPAPLKEMARVGGWGWILGDIGSGFEVGREALREILARGDLASVSGHPETATGSGNQSLQSRILSHFGISTVPDLFGVIYAPDPQPTGVSGTLTSPTTEALPRERRISTLTPLVFQSAFEDGDELALTVVKRCAGTLAHHIASVLASPAPSSPGVNTVEAASSVLCLGGSLVGVAAYRNLMLEELKRLGHVFPAVEFVGGGDVAAAGAKGLAAAGQA